MSEENVEVVRRWWEGFNEDGMPPLSSSCVHDAIEIGNPLRTFQFAAPFRGHDGVRRMA